MTLGEVYDFDIGDEFQRYYTQYSGPPTYVKTTITNKYYSFSLDTVYYVYDKYSFTPPACPPPCTSTVSSSVGLIISYSHLSDTVGIGYGTKPDLTCIDTIGYTGVWLDTTYYDSTFCNRLVTKIAQINGVLVEDSLGCFGYFEAGWGYDIYGKGIGIRSHFYTDCSFGGSPCTWEEFLFYYKKGAEVCGSPSSVLMPVSVYELAAGDRVKLFPNPANSSISLDGIEQEWACQIIDIYGRIIVQEISMKESIDISSFSNGSYLVKITTDKGFVFTKRFVKI